MVDFRYRNPDGNTRRQVYGLIGHVFGIDVNGSGGGRCRANFLPCKGLVGDVDRDRDT